MATAYEVRLYDVCTGKVKATYLGIVPSRKEAMVRCVECSSLAFEEKSALISKIRWGIKSQQIDTQRWSFTVQTAQTMEA